MAVAVGKLKFRFLMSCLVCAGQRRHENLNEHHHAAAEDLQPPLHVSAHRGTVGSGLARAGIARPPGTGKNGSVPLLNGDQPNGDQPNGLSLVAAAQSEH